MFCYTWAPNPFSRVNVTFLGQAACSTRPGTLIRAGGCGETVQTTTYSAESAGGISVEQLRWCKRAELRPHTDGVLAERVDAAGSGAAKARPMDQLDMQTM